VKLGIRQTRKAPPDPPGMRNRDIFHRFVFFPLFPEGGRISDRHPSKPGRRHMAVKINHSVFDADHKTARDEIPYIIL
jgi:hypothetical protein